MAGKLKITLVKSTIGAIPKPPNRKLKKTIRDKPINSGLS